jgi:putative transcriptional regulator
MPMLKLSIHGLLVLTFSLIAGWAQPLRAQTDEPVLLVATPEMRGLYGHTVLVAVPAGDDRHLGFIINRPTSRSMANLFPEHMPSREVKAPVYLGGPERAETIFAVVPDNQAPHDSVFPFLPGLSVLADVKAIDAVIERTPNAARYYLGFVAWKPGELKEELEKGFWYIMKPEPTLLFRERPEDMWKELLKEARAPESRVQLPRLPRMQLPRREPVLTLRASPVLPAPIREADVGLHAPSIPADHLAVQPVRDDQSPLEPPAGAVDHDFARHVLLCPLGGGRDRFALGRKFPVVIVAVELEAPCRFVGKDANGSFGHLG